ncbi:MULTISPECIES: DUF2182 domain-containing protein [Mycobacteriaceae]|uniref:DUF2182 domain-containing protein n=1 Tax=Mycobacteriaceae TaxID=1762 RepID=UPI001FEE313E|nr:MULTISPECIES: DUF2182 domain-containing protein [Mycobacteriaceae]ULP48432.1 DUF2182 domain-containing protein [Mycolicibacter virginiensis]
MPGRSWTDVWLPAVLLSVAGVGWWWSVVSARGMGGDTMTMDGDSGMSMGGQSPMSFSAFLIAWVAMMAAMMLPAVVPVVRSYARAAAAPALIFVAGYLALWSATGIPAFVAWSHFTGPVAHGSGWAGRLAGAVAVAAGLYQLTPLKATCLRHCRWPMPLSLPPGQRPDYGLARALVAGGRYGMFCLGSCWMLFVLLIALGTMQLAWMLSLSVVIWLERTAPFGDRVRRWTAATLVVVGVALLVHPAFVSHLV